MPGRRRALPRSIPERGRIGVFALSGPVPAERLAAGLDILERAGVATLVAPNVGSRDGYLAGADAERLAGLEWLLDRGVDALLGARGGYGATRLLSDLPWSRLSDWGGWVVGFSDLTAVHLGAASRLRQATLLGPMATTLARHRASTSLMLDWLRGRPPRALFRFGPGEVVRGGRAHGVATGGNLSLLGALAGTPFALDGRGAVLFLEDVGEPIYRLDRLLTQLRLSSNLGRVNAIVAGRLDRCGRGEADWRERWRALLAEAAPQAVVVEGLPFGHGTRHVPVPLGVDVTVDTAAGAIWWGGE